MLFASRGNGKGTVAHSFLCRADFVARNSTSDKPELQNEAMRFVVPQFEILSKVSDVSYIAYSPCSIVRVSQGVYLSPLTPAFGKIETMAFGDERHGEGKYRYGFCRKRGTGRLK